MIETLDYLSPGDLSQGDIVLTYLTATRQVGEGPPGVAYDPIARVPGYGAVATHPLDGQSEVAISQGFAVIVTHSCEIDRQLNRNLTEEHWDCRIGVAPVVSYPMAPDANWKAIALGQAVGCVYLPPVEANGVAAEVPPAAWPESFADLRSISVSSRAISLANRVMRLGPARLADLQLHLSRYFVFRVPSRIDVIEEMRGKRIVNVVQAPGEKLVDVSCVAEDGSTTNLRIKVPS